MSLSETVTLPALATSAREARRVTERICLAAHVPCDVAETAVLLVSETVTNAVIHGRSEARLCIEACAGGVRVEVGDDNTRHPVLQSHDLAALDGRGIGMLEVCATHWGVSPDPFGKVVWFEVLASA